ncbi:MAG TPA: hypothetical protein ACFYD4_03385 [Candidatus Wunengus sp. YC61]
MRHGGLYQWCWLAFCWASPGKDGGGMSRLIAIVGSIIAIILSLWLPEVASRIVEDMRDKVRPDSRIEAPPPDKRTYVLHNPWYDRWYVSIYFEGTE